MLTIEPPPACIMSGATAWAAEELMLQVDGDPLVPEFRRDVLDRVTVVARRVVDQDRDRPRALRGCRRPRASGRRCRADRRARTAREHVPAGRHSNCFEAVQIDVDETDPRALGEELADDGLANAGAAAGHQHSPVVKAWIDRRPALGFSRFGA